MTCRGGAPRRGQKHDTRLVRFRKRATLHPKQLRFLKEPDRPKAGGKLQPGFTLGSHPPVPQPPRTTPETDSEEDFVVVKRPFAVEGPDGWVYNWDQMWDYLASPTYIEKLRREYPEKAARREKDPEGYRREEYDSLVWFWETMEEHDRELRRNQSADPDMRAGDGKSE